MDPCAVMGCTERACNAGCVCAGCQPFTPPTCKRHHRDLHHGQGVQFPMTWTSYINR